MDLSYNCVKGTDSYINSIFVNIDGCSNLASGLVNWYSPTIIGLCCIENPSSNFVSLYQNCISYKFPVNGHNNQISINFASKLTLAGSLYSELNSQWWSPSSGFSFSFDYNITDSTVKLVTPNFKSEVCNTTMCITCNLVSLSSSNTCFCVTPTVIYAERNGSFIHLDDSTFCMGKSSKVWYELSNCGLNINYNDSNMLKLNDSCFCYTGSKFKFDICCSKIMYCCLDIVLENGVTFIHPNLCININSSNNGSVCAKVLFFCKTDFSNKTLPIAVDKLYGANFWPLCAYTGEVNFVTSVHAACDHYNVVVCVATHCICNGLLV